MNLWALLREMVLAQLDSLVAAQAGGKASASAPDLSPEFQPELLDDFFLSVSMEDTEPGSAASGIIYDEPIPDFSWLISPWTGPGLHVADVRFRIDHA